MRACNFPQRAVFLNIRNEREAHCLNQKIQCNLISNWRIVFMGEAKRRKALLGDAYGKPPRGKLFKTGSTTTSIVENVEKLTNKQFQECMEESVKAFQNSELKGALGTVYLDFHNDNLVLKAEFNALPKELREDVSIEPIPDFTIAASLKSYLQAKQHIGEMPVDMNLANLFFLDKDGVTIKQETACYNNDVYFSLAGKEKWMIENIEKIKNGDSFSEIMKKYEDELLVKTGKNS